MRKVLVIDDTKNIRMLLTTCLECKDFEVLTAEDGKSAINIIKQQNNTLNLIFLDIRMPEMNGTEVLRVIRDLGVRCPVVVMTAYATVKNAIECTKLGAVAYLQKPFSPDRINSLLQEIFSSNTNSEDNGLVDDEEANIISKAKALIEGENLDEAHNILKTALSINPYNKEIYFLIGEVNKGLYKPKEAKIFTSMYELFD